MHFPVTAGMVLAFCFIIGQFACYFWYTPNIEPHPIIPARFDKIVASGLYGFAYILSLLRLPFAVLPYCLKVFGVLVLKRHYQVSHYQLLVEVLRVAGDFANWLGSALVFEWLALRFPLLKFAVHASIFAEALRLFAEKGQMVVSALWQFLPHRRFATYLYTKLAMHGDLTLFTRHAFRYCQYYKLDNQGRIGYIMSVLHGYAAADPEAATKLAYLSTLRIVAPSQGIRGGLVCDVARGEIFVHAQWLADPWLVVGQALRRTPWLFDPRFLARPFRYRTQSNRLATLFVLRHSRYCPTYALYQFGHEIKVARYDFFYRLLRRFGHDVEPLVQADGTFPFDPLIRWLNSKRNGERYLQQAPLWADQDTIEDIRNQTNHGENLSAMDIAVQYTYPLKYVQEILLAKISFAPPTALRDTSQ